MNTVIITSTATVLSIINIIFLIFTCIKADEMGKDRETFVLEALKDVIVKWYTNRNIFGVIMSSIIFVGTIPGMLILVALELLLWLICLIASIWDMGTRKSE